MASSGTLSGSAKDNGSQEYPYPCHVNAASFISFKLYDNKGFGRWNKQIMCLVESHDMLGFIDGTLTCPQDNGDSGQLKKYKEWKRSDALVKGWIFGSISEQAMDMVIDLDTAHDVWERLKTICTSASTDGSGGGGGGSSGACNEDTAAKYIPLHRAIQRGNWEEALEIFNKDKDAITAKLTADGENAIHIAISNRDKIEFLQNLMENLNPELLNVLTDFKYSVLHSAAIFGNPIAAKMVVERKPHLLFLANQVNQLPIHSAVLHHHTETFIYLLHASKQYISLSEEDGYQSPFEGILGVQLFDGVIHVGLLDVAYELIKEFPDLARTRVGNYGPLKSISTQRDSFLSGTRYNFYQRFVYSCIPIENNFWDEAYKIKDVETHTYTYTAECRRSCFYSVVRSICVKFWKVAPLLVPHVKHLQEDKVIHTKAVMLMKCICKEVSEMNTYGDFSSHYTEAFNQAMIQDTPEALEVITDFFPHPAQSVWNGYSISRVAILNRCEKVYNYMKPQTFVNHLHKTILDNEGNNLLHLAAKLAPIYKLDLVSGAALQMQRELQWFEEVKKSVLPCAMEQMNYNSETPMTVFRKEHKQLRKDGEAWMKKTADSYTITAALIITIAFAAAITVPGGNNSDTGKAIYLTNPSFTVFAISDAISLFTSTNSLLLFLSILTARYREDDFLYRLPKRLALGLTMLFLSVTSMMVAFSATLHLMFGDGETWILILIAAFTCLPIASFMTLQFPLLFEIIYSTYGHGIFAK